MNPSITNRHIRVRELAGKLQELSSLYPWLPLFDFFPLSAPVNAVSNFAIFRFISVRRFLIFLWFRRSSRILWSKWIKISDWFINCWSNAFKPSKITPSFLSGRKLIKSIFLLGERLPHFYISPSDRTPLYQINRLYLYLGLGLKDKHCNLVPYLWMFDKWIKFTGQTVMPIGVRGERFGRSPPPPK